MKKLNYLLLGLAAVAITSCSQEDMLKGNNTGDGNLNITVKLPGDMATRALGDGFASTNLKYAVYDVTGDLIDNPVFKFEDEAIFDGSLTTTVSLQLVEGKQYKLAFFAYSPDAEDVYSFNPDNTTGETPNIYVDYSEMTGVNNNKDAYDCFYALSDVYTVGTSGTETVTLTRPMAQINWGTSEIDENPEIIKAYGNGGEYIETNVTIENGTFYNQLNLLDGEVESDGTVTTLSLFADSPAGIPTDNKFPVDPDTYDYIACQYLLVPASENVYDLTLNISNGGKGNPSIDNKAVPVFSAPIQANYRTNIFGTLLSTNTTFNVTKDDQWGDPSNDINYDEGPLPVVWSGDRDPNFTIPSSKTEPVIIDTPEKLASLADIVAGRNGKSANNLSGYTIKLTNDFDMQDMQFPMIGTANQAGGYTIPILNIWVPASVQGNNFQGVLDGQGHTISNIKIVGGSNNTTNPPTAGFIAGLSGSDAEVMNLKFENIQISAPNLESSGIIGLVYNNAKVTNVTVESGKISSKEGAGGIVGRIVNSGTITDCTNYAEISVTSTESSKGNAGGIVGAAYYTKSPGITISNCNNYGNVKATTAGAGGIAGLSGANIIGCTNDGQVGDNFNASNIGGIVGLQYSCGSIKNCVNNGKVQGNQYVAGILGWAGGVKYDLEETFVLTGNTNNGEINGNSTTAGIMTINRMTVDAFANINKAPSVISNNGSAAGLINGGYGSGATSYGNGYINIYTEGSQANVNETPTDMIKGTKASATYIDTFWDLSMNQAVKF